MTKITIWLIITSLLLFFGRTPVMAQTYDIYVWSYLQPTNITGVDDLKTKLESEVNKIIRAGHLAPFRALYGEGRNVGGQYYWYQHYATVYTLSLAYPYLSASTKTALAQYLKTEIASYPPWKTTLLPATGTKRQNDYFSPGLFEQEYANHTEYGNRPQLFALYATWLYAQNTGDWDTINTNWSTITSYNTNRRSTEVGKYYSAIAGSIGLARMAQYRNDTAVMNAAVTDANTGFNNGKNFAQYSQNATTAYQFNCGEAWSYCIGGTYQGFQFIDITPEIGRQFREDPVLTAAILGNSTSDSYSLKKAEYIYPLWYMAQAPSGNVYFGEGSGLPPDAKAMIFPIKVWVQQIPANELRRYLDISDALLGDYYYIQNLIRTIEAHGTECWEDARTSQKECDTGSLPSLTPTPNPKPGDTNNDGKVNGLDFAVFFNHFGTISSGAINGDFNGDNKVDASDFEIWATHYGL